jgi:hypothetical protein
MFLRLAFSVNRAFGVERDLSPCIGGVLSVITLDDVGIPAFVALKDSDPHSDASARFAR